MRRFFCIFLALILFVPALTSCGNSRVDNDKITIVTTVFAEYDWTRQILGDTADEVELIFLTENGTDLHSYQPSVADMAKITTCDLLIYTGGSSDKWIDEALSLSPSDKQAVLRLTGLMSDENLLFEQSAHHDSEHHHNEEYDEHVWLSLRLAISFCEAIRDMLSALIPENEQKYRDNCAGYIRQLESLHQAYEREIASSPVEALVFADRFPFSYLFHDYSLTCYAAFPGCSSETEASFKTVSELAEAIDRLSLPAVIILENADEALAKTVIATTVSKSATIVPMDSMQSVTRADINEGTTYLSIMTQNLSALRIALGQ